MKRRWIAVAATTMVCMSVVALAAGKQADNGKTMPRKHLVWLVSSIGSNSVLLVRNDRSETTNLTVSAGTQVFVNGPLGQLSAAQPGMRAEFSASDGGVTRLAFFDYTPPSEAPHVEKAAKTAKAVSPARPKKSK